jgi:hypothetical protein
MTHLIDQTIDIFCHRLYRVDRLGPNCRLIFTVPSVDEAGCEQVAVKLIVPADFMATLASMAVGAERERFSPDLIGLQTVVAN